MSGRTLAGRLVVVTIIMLVASALTGCSWSHGGSGRAGKPSAASVDPACDSVETLFAKMSVQSAGWSPVLHPFDQAMAIRIGNLAEQLATQQRKARDADVRNELANNVRALNRLDNAMATRKSETAVAKAAGQMRAAYLPLKGVCRMNGAVPAKASKSGSKPSPSAAPSRSSQRGSSAGSAAHGPACTGAQRIFKKMAVVSAAWSPQKHPFDPATARRTRALGKDLASVAATARSPLVHNQMRATAATLEGISSAMDARHRNKVYDALGKAQLAYSQLRVVCSLG